MEKSFLQQVVNDLISKANGVENLGNTTIVLPMQRAGKYMAEMLKEKILSDGQLHYQQGQIPKPVLLPRYTTINNLIDELSDLNADDEIRSVVLLHEIYVRQTASIRKADEAPMSLDLFYNWGKQLLTDFGNIDKSNVDAIKLLENATDAKELEGNKLDEDVLNRLRDLFPRKTRCQAEQDSAHRQFEQLWQQMPLIYQEFQALQAKEQVGYDGARLRRLITTSENWLHRLVGRKFVFVGFNYLQDGEKQLMILLRDNNQAVFYWDYRPEFQTNPVAYQFIEKNMKDLPNALLQEKGEKTSVTAVATTTTNVQAQYVRNWLNERKDILNDDSRNDRFAIVIADESMLEPVLYAIPKEFASKVNITKGYPMRSTRVYSDIIKQVEKECFCVQQQEKHCEDVLDELLNKTLLLEDNLQENTLFFEADSADSITWQEQLENESIAKARSVVSRIKLLFEDKVLSQERNCDMHTLLNVLRRQLEAETISFAGEPIMDIQIIGVLETRLLDFDHILVIGMEEGILPATPADRSFIPYYLRKYYHLQTNDEGAWAYAYNFFRLLRRCNDATLLFSDALDGGRKGMSRFLMQIMTNPQEFSMTKMRIKEDTTIVRSTMREQEILSKPENYTFRITPSATTNYLRCPRIFYYRNVLGLSGTEKTDSLFQVFELGSLIHALVQSAYSIITNGEAGLLAQDAKEQLDKFPKGVVITAQMINDFLGNNQLIEEALEKAYFIINENYERHHGKQNTPYYVLANHPVENEVAKVHMRKVLQNDADKDFTLLGMEIKRYISLNVPGVGELNIGGEIDRLDVVEELGLHRLRILDYKTGKYDDKKTKASLLDNIFKIGTEQYYILQTLIYCLVCAEQDDFEAYDYIMPTLLFTGNKLDDFDPHLFVEKYPIIDFRKMLPEFKQKLISLIQEMYNAVETGSYQKCKDCGKFCDFKLLCGK